MVGSRVPRIERNCRLQVLHRHQPLARLRQRDPEQHLLRGGSRVLAKILLQ
jgi:hypothetical protein